VSDQEAPARRISWPTLIVVGLAAFGAITLVQWVLSIAFSLVRLAIVVGIVAALVMFFRGPPDGKP
jgi:K+ transporter